MLGRTKNKTSRPPWYAELVSGLSLPVKGYEAALDMLGHPRYAALARAENEEGRVEVEVPVELFWPALKSSKSIFVVRVDAANSYAEAGSVEDSSLLIAEPDRAALELLLDDARGRHTALKLMDQP